MSSKIFAVEVLNKTRHHLYTTWLFNVNDIKTMVFPSLLFALSTGTALLRIQDKITTLEAFLFLVKRIPHVVISTYCHLLCFTVNNHRQEQSILEDQLNKPWRPLPTKRITISQARYLGFASYGWALSTTFILRCDKRICLFLFLLFYLYNDIGGDSRHWLIRNLLNAGGFTTFGAGALQVAMKDKIPSSVLPWILLVAAAVATTVHSQDMCKYKVFRPQCLRIFKALMLTIWQQMTRKVTKRLIVRPCPYALAIFRLVGASQLLWQYGPSAAHLS